MGASLRLAVLMLAAALSVAAPASSSTHAAIEAAAPELANVWQAPAQGATPQRCDVPCEFDPAKAFGGFNGAYQASECGDVALVKGGSYNAAAQIMRYKAALDVASCGTPVVFRSAAGEDPQLTGGMMRLGQCSTYGPPHNLTLDDIDFVDASIKVDFCTRGQKGSVGVTLQNIEFAPSPGQKLSAASVRGFALRNVDFGATCCDSDTFAISQGARVPTDPVPNGVLLENVSAHDNRTTCADIPKAAWPECEAKHNPYTGNHLDCLQSGGIANLTIRDSSFTNCTGTVRLLRDKGPSWNWRVENTVFDGVHGFDVGSKSPIYAFLGADPETGAQSKMLLYHNTLRTHYSSWSISDVDPAAHVELIGNISTGYIGSPGCYMKADAGMEVARFDVALYNMSTAGAEACGPTNLTQAATFVQPESKAAGPPDFHLAAGSPGIDQAGECWKTDVPRRDFEDDPRPTPTHLNDCDIGYDETA